MLTGLVALDIGIQRRLRGTLKAMAFVSGFGAVVTASCIHIPPPSPDATMLDVGRTNRAERADL